jgi:hypothetical protein
LHVGKLASVRLPANLFTARYEIHAMTAKPAGRDPLASWPAFAEAVRGRLERHGGEGGR